MKMKRNKLLLMYVFFIPSLLGVFLYPRNVLNSSLRPILYISYLMFLISIIINISLTYKKK